MKCRGQYHLWFQITVTDSILMQYHQPLQDQAGDLTSVFFRNRSILFHTLTQIAVLNILHCQVDSMPIFIPAEENYKKLRMLRLYVG